MKKQWAFVLSAGLTVSTAMPVLGANFADINDAPWEGAKEYINSVADQGLLIGDTNASGQTVFRPKDQVTYCEAAQMVYNLLKKSGKGAVSGDETTTWAKVLEKSSIPAWAYDAVAYGLDNSIITADDLSLFMNGSTSNPAVREEVALLFGRALQSVDTLNESASLSFADASQISPTAAPYIDLLVRLNVLKGDDANNFHPQNPINRSEMAVMLSQALTCLNGTSSKPTEKTSGSFSGTVTKVESMGDRSLVTLSDGDTSRGFVIEHSIKTTSGGDEVEASGIEVGDGLTIQYKDGGATVTGVDITNDLHKDLKTNTSTSSKSRKGTITSATSSRIGPKEDGSTTSFTIADKNKLIIKLDSKTKDIDEWIDAVKNALEDEEEISATLTLDSYGQVTEIQATTESSDTSTKSGKITSISSSKVTIKPSSGSEKSYYYEDVNDLEIKVDSKTRSIDEVKTLLKTKTLTADLTINDDDEVTKITAKASTSSSSSSDSSEGDLSSLSRSSAKVSGDSTKYTIDPNNITVNVKDGTEEKSITHIDDLIEAFEHDRQVRVTLYHDGDTVSEIKGSITRVEGTLEDISGDVLSMDINGTNFRYAVSNWSYVNYRDDYDKQTLLNNLGRVDVKLYLEDNYVTEIEVTRQR